MRTDLVIATVCTHSRMHVAFTYNNAARHTKRKVIINYGHTARFVESFGAHALVGVGHFRYKAKYKFAKSRAKSYCFRYHDPHD